MLLFSLAKNLINEIKFRVIRLKQVYKNAYKPVFPYSDNFSVKREQVWANLKEGIFFEDTGTFIPWYTSPNKLFQYSEQTRDNGYQKQWYFGNHTLLNGYKGQWEAHNYYSLLFPLPLTKVSMFLGFDYKGMEEFYRLKKHLIDLLGEPTKTDPEMFGSLDVGCYEWTDGNTVITLLGFEQFACKYFIDITIANSSK